MSGSAAASPSRITALSLAQLLSIAGDRIHYLALVALFTAGGTGSGRDGAGALAGLGVAMLLPTLLFSPLAGPLVDRWPLVRTLVITDLARALVVAALPALWVIGGVDALLAGVFLGFTLNVFFLPARSAIPARLVAPARRLSLNALLALCGVAATLAGSALGGPLVDRIGWRNALYVDAATFAVSAVLLLSLRGVDAPRRTRRIRLGAYARQIASGFVLLWRRPPARRAAIAAAGLWIGGGVLHVAGALHAQPEAGSVGRLGALMATFGAGLAASTLWTMRARRLSAAWALSAGLGGAAVGLMAFAATRLAAAHFASALWIGVWLGPLVAAIDTELQAAGGERRRGRLFAARDFVSRVAFLIALGAASGITTAFSPQAALLLGALAIAALGAAAAPRTGD